MFNVSQIFGQKRLRKNEVLNKNAQNKVIETKSLLEKEDWATAEILIEDLIRKHPHNADCCWLFGRLCAHRSQFDTAILHFKHCIQLVATHADCYCTYGATLGILKKYDEEEEMYRKCLDCDPTHHLCHYNYGRLCVVKSDYKNAEKHYKEAIEHYTKDAHYYTHYGLLLKTVKRNEEAKKHFELAIAIDPTNDKTHYLYSKLLQSMGELSEAIATLQRACKLNPSNKEYQRLLYIMNRSKKKPRLKRSESSSPLSPRSKTQTPGGPRAGSDLHDLLYNNDINKLDRSQTINLAVLNDEEPVAIPVPPKVVKRPFRDSVHERDSDEDAYFKKAVELYKNKAYDEAESILKLVITVQPNHEAAQRLYKYLSQKLYTKKKPHHQKTLSSPVLSTIAKEAMKEAEEEKEKEKEKEIVPKAVERDPCQLEFIRFLEDRVKLNKQYPDLYQRFETLGYDNIRFVFDFDLSTLMNEVKMKRLHCKIFMRKIEVFTAEANAFRKWLKRIVSCNEQYSSMAGLIDRLENEGILTFESLYRCVFTKQDLIQIIGKEFNNIYSILWREIQNQQTDLMSAVNVNPAYSTPGTQQHNNDEEEDENQEEGKTAPTSHSSH